MDCTVELKLYHEYIMYVFLVILLIFKLTTRLGSAGDIERTMVFIDLAPSPRLGEGTRRECDKSGVECNINLSHKDSRASTMLNCR